MILKNGKRLDGMGDSMPIGSVIEYNGTDIPDGWEILPDEEGDIYSEEEHKIGRWINGKPIYRKCFTLDTRIALGNGHTKMTTLAAQGIINWEDITHIGFTVKDDHAGYFSNGFYTNETDASRCWVSSDWVMFLCGTAYGCGDTTFIIEYTKTTD